MSFSFVGRPRFCGYSVGRTLTRTGNPDMPFGAPTGPGTPGAISLPPRGIRSAGFAPAPTAQPGMTPLKYAAINSMLDQISTCLDQLEEKNDHLHARLKELLESNQQTRVEFQQQQQLSEGPPAAKPHS
ncbi:bublin coiled-coil protein isoform X1 [Monodelphis domestica]|uniref:bublin coiled-coil protein isoform X1 n=1 Tax=Monodelphis domestica TaxID=13616 RepID=UPI0024E1D432|nr:bublin coiled-coil protein isoform X1 [Monodelphis domestica]